ncbi:MAG: hypothetical protein ACRES5_34855 [Pseudomonas sp.]|uniref:hypothetical protein n=1 Tax=Stenotrophomonas sp. TaxID=69392 RepID=UPI003D6CCDA6
MTGGIDYLRVALSLGFCLALGVAAIYFIRAKGRLPIKGRTRDMRLLESMAVDTRTSVHVIEYRSCRFLLTSSTGNVHLSPLPSERPLPTNADVAAEQRSLPEP